MEIQAAHPGWHLELGESFEECAIREVLEETRLKITSPRFLAVTNDSFLDKMKHYISIFMLATKPLGQITQNREYDKTEPWQWFSINSLPEKLFLPLKHLVLGNYYGRGLSEISSIKELENI